MERMVDIEGPFPQIDSVVGATHPGEFLSVDAVGTLDFDITAEERDALYNRELHAAQEFLESWDYPNTGGRAVASRPLQPRFDARRRRELDSEMLCGTT
jgi:hypothetical protein